MNSKQNIGRTELPNLFGVINHMYNFTIVNLKTGLNSPLLKIKFCTIIATGKRTN